MLEDKRTVKAIHSPNRLRAPVIATGAVTGCHAI